MVFSKALLSQASREISPDRMIPPVGEEIKIKYKMLGLEEPKMFQGGDLKKRLDLMLSKKILPSSAFGVVTKIQ